VRQADINSIALAFQQHKKWHTWIKSKKIFAKPYEKRENQNKVKTHVKIASLIGGL
jgi:hypothetical protein